MSGFGLGLYITKLIVKDHQGDVRASSPGLGKGSTFSLELPLAKDTPVVAKAVSGVGATQ